MAGNYAILRTQKLKSLPSIKRSMKHSFREQDTPNADPSRADDNLHFGANSATEAEANLRALLPEKRRKDAVLAIEYLITASPDAMKGKSKSQQDDYFRDSLNWLARRHGIENIAYAGVHRDETTPHLYAYIVPLDRETGRLNAKKWLGGAKALSEMQTDFHESVGASHELDRGIEGSKARHNQVKKHYTAVTAELPHREPITVETLKPRIKKKGLIRNHMESDQEVAKRISEKVADDYYPVRSRASEASQVARRAEELQRTAESQRRRINELEASKKLFSGITRDQHKSLVKEAERMREANIAEKQMRRQRGMSR